MGPGRQEAESTEGANVQRTLALSHSGLRMESIAGDYPCVAPWTRRRPHAADVMPPPNQDICVCLSGLVQKSVCPQAGLTFSGPETGVGLITLTLFTCGSGNFRVIMGPQHSCSGQYHWRMGTVPRDERWMKALVSWLRPNPTASV